MKVSSGAEDRIELTKVSKLGEEGFKCNLKVVSGHFSAAMEFWFDNGSARKVADCLETIYTDPKAEARLGFRDEPQYIDFKGDGLGHIDISGQLTDFGPPHQRLDFAFRTDQTLISGFLEELKNVLRLLIQETGSKL